MTEEERQEHLKKMEENLRTMNENGTTSLNEVAIHGVQVNLNGNKESQ